MARQDSSTGLFLLLPVRNGAAFLENYFACARRLGARIIALDDGSTDATRSILEGEELVDRVLANPQRPDFTGWDDAENRRRLLCACDDFPVRWILWLDADERLPESDADRLNLFLQGEAEVGKAYGLEVLRMIGDAEHFDRGRLWVYRLYAFAPGFTLPRERLHFEPVPDEIMPKDWIRTRLRIMHFSSVDEQARMLRYRKYREADPDCEWQEDYEAILDTPGTVWKIRPMAADRPVIIG